MEDVKCPLAELSLNTQNIGETLRPLQIKNWHFLNIMARGFYGEENIPGRWCGGMDESKKSTQ